MSKNTKVDLAAFLGPPKEVTYIEQFLGLTGWKKTAEECPPYIGWWRTWSPMRAERRWWNGHVWSIPVTLGHPLPAVAMGIATRQDSESILWSGLKRPHLAGYLEYRLIKSPRVINWEKIHGTGHSG